LLIVDLNQVDHQPHPVFHYRLSEDTLAKVLTKETSWGDRNVDKEITRLFHE
jgi:hypothetical protein